MFYRIDDLESMPGPLLCSYAMRVAAYGGVMSAIVANEQQKNAKTHDGQSREFVSNEQADAMSGGGYFEKVSANG